MSLYLQFVVLGLSAGAVYAALANGLISIYRATGILNFGLGATALWGAYVYAGIRASGEMTLPVGSVHVGELAALPALAIALVTAVVLSLLAHLLIFRPLRSAPTLAHRIIISPSDGTALANAVEVAHENDVPVMVYDALIMNSPYVTYYATDDLYAVGATQGKFLVDALGVAEGKGPFNLEIFSGSMTDNNATYFYQGAMDQLQPYIDNGQLVVKSGQIDRTSTTTEKWSATNAQTRADAILSTYYSDGSHLDACLTQNDDLAAGVISACKSAGYGTPENPLPLTTGQDCNVSAILSIINGEQSSTVFKNIKELAYAGAVGIDAMVHGEEIPWDPEMVGTYNNNVVDVTTYQVRPLLLTIDNWYELIVESGFYDAEDLGMTPEQLAAYAPK